MTSTPGFPFAVSLDTAAVLTGRSKRTWQRRIEEGLVPRLDDGRGRALVPFEVVRPAVTLELDSAEVLALVRADQGDAQAQAETGALFALATLEEARAQQDGREPGTGDSGAFNTGGATHSIAAHFLAQAAEQGEADAMHWLGLLHAAGRGEGDHDALALMWIAKAAAHGHVIAQQQLAGMVPSARG
ncbi:hypothetical protein [Xylophilus sp.]|uniref:hypothetical protein n=1 Tax=Xylophilus sp. TaxID=2653893 RepID=UPI0013BD7A71|nr:hypothetical protein [Xylophilus sp.]KAF1045513.1 MAG: hypothetical protein GAK38_02962 [Xylophilus sp.]